jgi:EmrB/QacA subfamily drug resistance transporter
LRRIGGTLWPRVNLGMGNSSVARVSGGRDPRWTLAVAILGSTLAFLDSTVVTVALPVMQGQLGIAVDLAQWVVEAYSLLLASLVLVGGALGDHLGRRRVFSAGVMLFAAASLACGLAPSTAPLIAARAVQGVGAALLVPGSLSLISAAYAEKERGAAIGTWSAFSAVTSAIGPVAGGWVVAHGSWRWLFLFNLPIAALVVALAGRHVIETRDETADPRMDWLGAALATSGLGLMVYALLETRPLLLIVGVAALIAFVVAEAKHPAPMMPLSLFRQRTFAGTNLLTFCLYAALGGGLFFVPFDLIQVQGYSPAAAGASLVPFVLLVSAMSRWAGGLAARRGVRPLLILGPLIAAGGFAALAVPTKGGPYWSTFFPGVLVLGLGMGVTVAPLTTAVMGSVAAQHAGIASGVNNAVARAAGLLAIAALGLVVVERFERVLDSELATMSLSASAARIVEAQRGKLAGADLTGIGDPMLRNALRRAFSDAYVAGFRLSMLVCAGLGLLGALSALWLVDSTSRKQGFGSGKGPPLTDAETCGRRSRSGAPTVESACGPCPSTRRPSSSSRRARSALSRSLGEVFPLRGIGSWWRRGPTIRVLPDVRPSRRAIPRCARRPRERGPS